MTLTPKKEQSSQNKSKKTPMKKGATSKSLSPNKEPVIKKELCASLEDVSFKDDSVSEIESTPTRHSPVIHPKKFTNKTLSGSTESRDKKKCPDDWLTPESKAVKLTFVNPYGKGGGRLRQAKLNLFVQSSPITVDLSSPATVDLSSPATVDLSSSDLVRDLQQDSNKSGVQLLIKKESSDNDDTIMPSPTSGPNNFLLTKTSKENMKPKRPLSLKSKTENSVSSIKSENKDTTPADIVDMEESINMLNSNNFAKPKIPAPVKQPVSSSKPKVCDTDISISLLGPVKMEPNSEILNSPGFAKPKNPSLVKPLLLSPDATVCETDVSMSPIKMEMEIFPHGHNSEILNYPSPKKRPLAENINVSNLPNDMCTQASVSILASNVALLERGVEENKAKRKTPEKIEPVYKEPVVRKKAEKQALPAWCCRDCEVFFGALYKDDPDREEKIAQTIANCSKHRGRQNPARPRTPPGFWDPRWDVPRDTEEFNRRNNAV